MKIPAHRVCVCVFFLCDIFSNVVKNIDSREGTKQLRRQRRLIEDRIIDSRPRLLISLLLSLSIHVLFSSLLQFTYLHTLIYIVGNENDLCRGRAEEPGIIFSLLGCVSMFSK